jgi:hypothetical protein
MVTRQPSVQIMLRPTSAALADIRSQRTMPLACGGARPASSALRTEPASVPVSFRPPGCSPTTDLARFGSAVPRSRANMPVRHRQRRPRAHGRSQDISEISQFATSAGLTRWIPVLAGLCLGVCDRGVGGERLPDGQRVRAYSQHSCISEVRAGPPSDSPRAAMRGPRPPSSVRRWRSSSRPAATSAAASARCHTGAGLRSRRRARRRPGRAAWAAATSQRRRHSGEPAHRRPCRRSRRGCRSTRHDRQAREPPSPAGGNPRTPGPARAHRRGCPNTVASSADGAADVDHAPAAQRSTSLRVIKRIVRSLKRCERADNDPGITPGSGKPRLTGGQHASIGSDRGWASRSLNGTANTFHDQQGCGILSVRTISRTAGSATEITAACRPYPSGFDHGQPNTAHAWGGGSGERS